MFYRKFSHCLVILLVAALLLPAMAVRADELGDSSQGPWVSDTDLQEPSEPEPEPPCTEEAFETSESAETELGGELESGEFETEYETETGAEQPAKTEQEISDTDVREYESTDEMIAETVETAETELLIPDTEVLEDPDQVHEYEGTDFLPEGEADTVVEQGTVDYVRSTTKVPVEGIPGAITQEMVSAVLYCQDETGFPASAALAQIIITSVRSDNTDAMTDKAYSTHNLFGLRDGAEWKSYNTDSESVFDYFDILKEKYTDIVKNASDLELYTEQFAQRWSGKEGYAKKLIRIIDKYQLYRLDKVTLKEFESLLPTYVNPCPDTEISSTFGYRELFHSMHAGIDLATGSRNIATYAAKGGDVIFAGESGLAGIMVSIRHEDGTVTNYMHHCEIYVEEGDYVFKGQQIGLAGSTGRSTGIHLHFEIEINGSAVNPAPYLTDDSSGSVIAMDSGRKRKYKLSKSVLGQILYDGTLPKHEVSVPKVKNSTLPGKFCADILGSYH